MDYLQRLLQYSQPTANLRPMRAEDLAKLAGREKKGIRAG
jgi:hypothetical protein